MGKEMILKLFHVYLMSVAGLFVVLVSISLLSQGMIHGRGFPLILALLLSFVGALILIGIFVWVGIGIAVYHDAKKRGMEPLLWALVATLVPYLLGLIAYLIIRHPIQSFCPSCSHPFTPGDVYCRFCGAAVQVLCSACNRPTAPAARFCPHCGAQLGESAAPPPGRPVVL
jgi:uncharacterized membrane protein YhaH (DUF805 family)